MQAYTRMHALVAMQLTNRKKFKKMKSKLHVLVYFLLRILLIAVVTLVVGAIMYLCNNFFSIEINQNLLLFFIAFMQIISIFGYTHSLVDNLYLSKDNAILLQFPARHSEIFISKMIVNYIVEFSRNLTFILPVLIAFGIMGRTPIDIGYWFVIPLLLIVLPLIPLFLGAILSIPYMYIRRLLKSIPLLQTFVGLGLLGVIVYLGIRILQLIPVPLRLLALYTDFISWLNGFIATVDSYLYGFQNIVNCLFPTRTALDFVITIGIGVVIVLLAYVLAMPLFFRIISHFSERSVEKRHDKVKPTKQRTVFGSYFYKELITIVRTPGKLFGYLSGIISFPFLLCAINYIFTAINTSNIGQSLVIGFNIMIGLVLATANNSSIATAISNEGAEFAVLKTAPSKTYKIVWSKICVHLIFSTIPIIVGFICLGVVTDLPVAAVFWLLLVFLLINTGHIFWSIQFDLLNPRLNDVALKGSAYNNPNVGKSILAGLLTATGFCAFAIFFMLDSYLGGWVKLIIAAAVFFVLRLLLLMANLKVYFKRIEF